MRRDRKLANRMTNDERLMTISHCYGFTQSRACHPVQREGSDWSRLMLPKEGRMSTQNEIFDGNSELRT